MVEHGYSGGGSQKSVRGHLGHGDSRALHYDLEEDTALVQPDHARAAQAEYVISLQPLMPSRDSDNDHHQEH